DKILTIQNQLTTLPQLHAQKPVASRLFKYLVQVTPATVKMSQLDMDFSTKTLNITGESDSLSSINKFVDTLKFTTYSSSDSADPTKDPKAFSNIVVASFGLENGKASYTINLNFDDKIFDISQDIKLTVPKIITTVSETEKPAAIFQPKTQEKN
ncbi:MAG TPA: hypothetical protein VLG25_00685, partial [Patescibacteria group bacterium]|nr:hypothetical protein [Patescibacteria group bacterium]